MTTNGEKQTVVQCENCVYCHDPKDTCRCVAKTKLPGVMCAIMREDESLCGKEAKLFVPTLWSMIKSIVGFFPYAIESFIKWWVKPQ